VEREKSGIEKSRYIKVNLLPPAVSKAHKNGKNTAFLF
jgi:hypothetical protein